MFIFASYLRGRSYRALQHAAALREGSMPCKSAEKKLAAKQAQERATSTPQELMSHHHSTPTADCGFQLPRGLTSFFLRANLLEISMKKHVVTHGHEIQRQALHSSTGSAV